MTSRFLLSVALLTSAFIPHVQARSLLIRGGTLIDGTGRGVIQDAQILIRDGVIADVRAGGALAGPAGVELLVDAGLTPMQAIQAATKNGADMFGVESRLGTIEKGKIANLVLLDANPLEGIANTKKIFRVIQGGRVIDTRYHADYEIPIKRPGPESKHLYNPVPKLQDVLPPVVVEGQSVDLRILGRGFTPNSVVKFDGRAVETHFVNSSELRATLTKTLTARVGTYLMNVETPKPGGGPSEGVEFLVTFK